jgi:hypothetical protein
MCLIIEFPQTQHARIEKVKEISEKRRKQITVDKPQPTQRAPIAQVTPIKLSLHVNGIPDLVKTLETNNDTNKYLTDCFYDLTLSIYSLKKAIVFIGGMLTTLLSILLIILILKG